MPESGNLRKESLITLRFQDVGRSHSVIPYLLLDYENVSAPKIEDLDYIILNPDLIDFDFLALRAGTTIPCIHENSTRSNLIDMLHTSISDSQREFQAPEVEHFRFSRCTFSRCFTKSGT